MEKNIQVILQIGAGDVLPYETTEINGAKSSEITSPKVEVINNPDPVINQKSFTNNLNTSMTFDNFVEGKSNQLAVASAKQVGERSRSILQSIIYLWRRGIR